MEKKETNMWYLRSYDLRAERMTDVELQKASRDFIMELRSQGMLFDSLEDANEASAAARAEIARINSLRKDSREFDLQRRRIARNASLFSQLDRLLETWLREKSDNDSALER